MNFNKESAYRNALRELFAELFSDNDLISIPEPDDDIEVALEFSEEVTQYNESIWASFLKEMKQYTSEIETSFNPELGLLILKLSEDFYKPPFYNDLQISFSLSTYSYENQKKNLIMRNLMGCLAMRL